MSEPTPTPDPTPTLNPALERRVEELAEAYLEQLQAGGRPDRTELLSAHPDLRGPLESRLDLVEVLHHLGRTSSSLPADRRDAPSTTPGAAPEMTLPFLADPRTLPESAAPTSLGRFRIEKELGSGSFGRVYKAVDPELDRTVALKVPRAGSLMTPQEQERFLREARSAARLRHEGIVPVHEIAQVNGLSCIVSDFIDGPVLSDVLPSLALDLPRAVELLARVADALEHAHRQGVVHRDVKPSNILLDGQGRPHVTDFGLARRDEGEATVTYTGQVLGTPAYMAPEQAAGENDRVDARADVYGLGVILYQILTGDLPFRGSTRALLQQVLHEDPRPPRQLNDQVPRDLETICLKCLAKEPERRYPTAAALADDLRRFLAGQPIHARPVGRMERAWRWCRRNAAVAALALTAALLLLTVGVLGSMLAWRYHGEAEEAVRAKQQAEAALRGEEEARLREAMAQANADRRQYEAEAARKELEEFRRARQERERQELSSRLKDRINPTSLMGLRMAAYRPMDRPPPNPLSLAPASGGDEKILEERNKLVREAAEQRRSEKYAEAITSLEKALKLTQQVGGEQQALVEASTYSELAHLYLLRKDLPGAQKALEKAAAVTAGHYGDRDWRAREAKRILDDVTKLAARKDTALKEYVEADAAAQKVPELVGKNDLKQATDLARGAWTARQQVLGKDHPLVAASQEELASVLAMKGEIDEAIKGYQDALALRKKLEGDEGPHVAADLYSLGTLYFNKGDLVKARVHFELALAAREVLYPLDRYPHGHPDLAASLESVALVLRQRRDNAEALTYAQRALAMYRSLYPKDKYPKGHRDVLRGVDTVAALLQAQGRGAQAMPYLKEALAMREALPATAAEKATDAEIRKLISQLGSDEYDVREKATDRLDKIGAPALEALRKAAKSGEPEVSHRADKLVSRIEKRGEPSAVSGRGDLDYAVNLQALGRVCQTEGKVEEAETYYQRAVALQKGQGDKPNAALMHSTTSLAQIAIEKGDHARAEKLLKDVVAMRAEMYGKDSLGYALGVKSLAGFYLDRGDYAKAEPLFREAGDLFKKHRGEKSADYAASLNYLGVLYAKKGDKAKAERYLNQARKIREALPPASPSPNMTGD